MLSIYHDEDMINTINACLMKKGAIAPEQYAPMPARWCTGAVLVAQLLLSQALIMQVWVAHIFVAQAQSRSNDAPVLHERLWRAQESHASDSVKAMLWAELSLTWALQAPDSALYYGKKALSVAEPQGLRIAVLHACRNISLALCTHGEYDEALRYGLRSIRVADSLQSPSECAISIAYVNIVYMMMGRHQESLAMFTENRRTIERYLERSRRREDSIALMTVCILGIYQLGEAGESQEAMSVGKRGLSLSQKLREHYWTNMARGMLADEYAQYNPSDSKAYALLAEAVREARKDGEQYFASLFAGNLALYLKQQGRYREALPFYRESIELAQSTGLRMELPRLYHEMAEAYHALGDNLKAYQAEQQSKSLQDSLFHERSTRRFAEMQTRYDTEKKEQQIRLLENEQARQQIIRLALIAVVVLVVIVLLVVASAYRQRRTNEAMLQEKNAVLLDVNMQLGDANKRLRELDTEKSEFLGIAAHDLKSPLAGIAMTARQLVEMMVATQQSSTNGVHGQNDVILSRLYGIERSAQTMSDIVTQLLDLNKMESGTLLLKSVLFDVVSRVEAVVDDCAVWAAAKSITIDIASEVPSIQVFADKNAVHQVVENLLSNALKFSPPHTRIILSILHSVERQIPFRQSCPEQHVAMMPKPAVYIVVQDSGPGISHTDRTKLFRKFTRLSAQATAGEHSTGLGLSIVKKLVEAMNGLVWYHDCSWCSEVSSYAETNVERKQNLVYNPEHKTTGNSVYGGQESSMESTTEYGRSGATFVIALPAQ